MTWQRTKIVCTLGPATDTPGVLAAMVRAGMDVARINLSHGTDADHARRIRLVREVSRDCGEPVAVLIDLPGPKFRLGDIAGGSRPLPDGARVILAEDGPGADVLPVRQREVLAALQPGHSVYLADGAVELRVVAATADRVACEVVMGGTVRSGSGLNVPESDLPGLVPTAQDRTLLAFAASQGVDWIGVSFVQAAADLARVRECLPDAAAPLLMAKIEKRRALASLDEIVESADGIMVARGDLGVETDLAEIPLVQKRIIAAANARARPVITATQMLESMVEHDHPTRAEVTDVANAVLDGTDAVMLSAESAVGRNPVAAVNILRRVVAATESEYAPRISAAKLHATDAVRPGDAIAFSACQLAKQLDARAIVIDVRTAHQAAALAQFRPTAPILAFAATEKLRHALALVSSVSPLDASDREDPRPRLARAAQWLYARALAQPHQSVVVVSSADADDSDDMLRVARLPA
ncbi:MAG TPA: pyruvate kinase [Burkholderiales bacterium]|nr:pyruvate kinase [Burkholderiales bacterium]